MPTNEERREIAARLRELETGDFCRCEDYLDALEDAIGCIVGKDYEEPTNRLADLIEPEPEKYYLPNGYLVVPDPTKNPHDSHFQVDKFTSVEDGINALANAVMRAEQNAIVMESLKRAGFAKVAE